MSKQIPCEIIQDLMPSYVDGVSSKVSNEAIEEHVRECRECASVLADMQAPEERVVEQEEQKREIDFLKKVKKRNRVIISGVVALAVVGLVFAIRFFIEIYGGEYVLTNIDYHVEVTGNKVQITGTAPEGFVVKERNIYMEDDVVYAGIYCAPETILNKKQTKEIQLESKFDEPFQCVEINGDILWQDGVEIDEYVAGVYQEKHAYIGDASQNDCLASKIGVYDSFGNFTSELQTAQEPYGWKLLLKNPVKGDVEKAQEKMKKYAYVMLAMIDNAGEISWEYKAEGVATAITYTVTTEGAKEELGVDVKSYKESAAKLQELMEKLELVD
nr:DUF4825 domain-containing protein [Eubacterium sp.]